MESEFKELDAKKGWAALYQQIRSESNQFDFTIKEAKKSENKELNRYRDVSPYDHSRVKLQCGDKDYINASLLKVPDAHRAYILTQGPLPRTTSHFWQMVWEQKSKAVLMLNKVIEKNAIKCHQYWPLGTRKDGDDVMELTDVGLRVEYVSEKEASYYTVRHLRLLSVKSGESRIVLHFHYTTWPDFSVPQSPSAFLNFLFAVRESGALDENVGPPVVHCSAGIGRSGTFCLVDSCLIMIEKFQDLNAVDIKRILLEMRKYRMGLIQTPDQLRFSYLAVLEGAKRVLIPDREQDNGHGKCGKHTIMNSSSEEEDDDDEEEDDDDESSALSKSSEDTSESRHYSDRVPPLPPKRMRRDSSDGDSTNNLVNSFVGNNDSHNQDPKHTIQNNKITSEECGKNVKSVTIDKESEEKRCMTMKDGAVVMNFSEKLREAELRKRQRKERNEKMREKVKEIQQKQQESERWKQKRSLLKPISISLLMLLGGGYLVYRYFWKG